MNETKSSHSFSQTLGIYLGESFAEYTMAGKSRRVYLPKEPLKKSLPLFLKSLDLHLNEGEKLRVRVSYGFLERIISFKLGGTLAVLVTDGFEKWADLRESAPWQNSMSNPDLVFPVRERISATGEVVENLELSSLEAIADKLAQMSVKRVAIQFLHSDVNPTHLKLAESFFQSRNYEIFSTSSSDDEVADWRRALLDAGLSGTFEELTRELTEAITSTALEVELEFHSSQGFSYSASDSQSKSRRVETMLSHYELAAKFLRSKVAEQGFYFGIEGFCEINAKQIEKSWNSPWGRISAQHPFYKAMPIQPTSVLEVDGFGDLSFRNQGAGFEPGPICLGRGQSVQWLDLFAEDIQQLGIPGISELILETRSAKLNGTLMSLRKATNHSARDNQALIDNLKKQSIQLLYSRMLGKRRPLIFGPLAPLIISKNPIPQVLLAVNSSASSSVALSTAWPIQTCKDSAFALSQSLVEGSRI